MSSEIFHTVSLLAMVCGYVFLPFHRHEFTKSDVSLETGSYITFVLAQAPLLNNFPIYF